MRDLVARVQRWWRPGRGRSGRAVPYEVTCACGEVVRGLRQARHQVVRCGACRQPVFVLPYSPLPGWSVVDQPAVNGAASPTPARGRPSPLRFWLWPLVAGGLTLLVAFAGLAFLVGSLRPPSHPGGPPAGEAIPPLVAAGRADLAAGKFRAAAAELDRAWLLLEQQPEGQRSVLGREVSQLRRQAALLRDLLTEPLGAILQNAATQHPDEWPDQFAAKYKGNAVVFDADVTRDGAGRLRLDFHVDAGAEPASLDVSDLRLLAALPRDRPPRLLFGARLASIAREQGGVWVVRFEPDSGVLLTDAGAVAACCPPADDDLAPLLRRQQEWLEQLR